MGAVKVSAAASQRSSWQKIAEMTFGCGLERYSARRGLCKGARVITPNAMKPVCIRNLCLAGFGAAILTACAGDGKTYPSLAIRDAERQAGVSEPTSPLPPVAPVASSQELAQILETAREVDASFREAQPGVRRLTDAARGLGIETNAYAQAAAAVATLSSLRGQTMSALGSLDQLETEAATSFAPLGEIRAAQSEVEAMLAQQSAALEAVSGDLAR